MIRLSIQQRLFPKTLQSLHPPQGPALNSVHSGHIHQCPPLLLWEHRANRKPTARTTSQPPSQWGLTLISLRLQQRRPHHSPSCKTSTVPPRNTPPQCGTAIHTLSLWVPPAEATQHVLHLAHLPQHHGFEVQPHCGRCQDPAPFFRAEYYATVCTNASSTPMHP